MFEYLHVNFAIFESFLKFYRNFRENLGKILENFGNMDLLGVRGAEPPPPTEASENIRNRNKKVVEQSIENCKILKLFMKF